MNQHARAVANLSVSAGVATLSQIAKGKLAAVLLGPAGVGTLSQLKYLFNLLQFLCGLGFYNGLIRHVAEADRSEDREKVQQHVSSVMIVVSATSIGGTLVAMLLAPQISAFLFNGDETKTGYVLIILMSVPFAVAARVYKGILSAFRNVRGIVLSQIIADISSIFLFASLTIPLGLYGAALAFCCYHLLRSVLNIAIAVRSHGASEVLPLLSKFRKQVIRENMSFGVVAMIIMPLSMVTTITVSRWIIAKSGLDANGIFAAAWTVSSVYLRVLYESASSYFLPVMSQAKDDVELKDHLDGALRLYMLGIPPVVFALVTMGETVISIMFSRDFAASGVLLAWLLPTDLLRIVAETLGLSLIARSNLKSYLMGYLVWAGVYLGISFFTIESFGVMGVCYAYACSHLVSVIIQLIFAKMHFNYRPSCRCTWIIIRGFGLAVIASLSGWAWPTIFAQVLTLIGCMAAWLVFSLNDPELKTIVFQVRRRLWISNKAD